jgi:hypothetical protein
MSTNVQANNGAPLPVSSQARWPTSSRLSRRIVKVMIIPNVVSSTITALTNLGLVSKRTHVTKSLPNNDYFDLYLISFSGNSKEFQLNSASSGGRLIECAAGFPQ